MIMRLERLPPAIPLFDHVRDHSSVPTEICTAVARNGGPGRPPGRRGRALPWTGASTAACWRRFGTVMRVMSIVAASLVVVHVIEIAFAESARAESEAVPPADPWTPFVTEASQRFGVPMSWIRAILNAESAGDVLALSPKGAIGLMQLMPKTWGELRSRYGLGADPFDPRDNILAGTAYIRELLDRYGTSGVLAAYNAGPTRYEDHLTTDRPLPAETRAFMAALTPIILDDQAVGPGEALAWNRAPLFIERGANNSAADRLSTGTPRGYPANVPVAVDVSALAPHSDGLFVRQVDGVEWQ